MKKNIFYLLLLMPLLAFLGSCDDKDEIVFDHELPQFELKENAILLEVIMPQGTAADEKIYIAGDFNGGETAVGQMEWCLEKAANSDVKWGIYLTPSTFENGKTLADGFYFVSEKQGVERTVKNEDVLHALNVGVGTRTNVTVSRWESYFAEEPDEETHDGYAIFIEDKSGWDALTVYAWGTDIPELFGAWPGIPATGTVTIKGITYQYFDTGKANEGLTYNLICNNNDGGKQFDLVQVELNRDYYFSITDSKGMEVDPENPGGDVPEPTPDPETTYSIYVVNNTGWDALTLYGYANDAPVTLAWPGMQVTGTKEIGGVTYAYFEMPAALTDTSLAIIFNNNGGGLQLSDTPVTLNRDYYFTITADKCTEMEAPADN